MNPAYFKTRFLGQFKPEDIPCLAYIITASNPMDNQLPDNENKQRNAQLQSIIKRSGSLCVPIIGTSEDLSHQETSFITDLQSKKVIQLAKKFNQRAIFEINMDNLSIIPCYEKEDTIMLGSFTDRLISSD